MSSQLPITINADRQLQSALNITKAMLEKLEAWCNFETLKAGWYGDTSLDIKCQITLVNLSFFKQHFIHSSNENWHLMSDNSYAVNEKYNFRITNVILPITENCFQNQSTSPWIESELQASIQQYLTNVLNDLATCLKLSPLLNYE